jgi:ABC-type lipoprotein export system ATPase subunit
VSFLEMRQVSKVYGEAVGTVKALQDLYLSVDRGELVAVMGPSGKSS